jgi:predicted translin family RNA/ssDNA-binding protein
MERKLNFDADQLEVAISLLKPVWSISGEEMRPIIDAVKKGNSLEIAKAVSRLEEKRTQLATDPYRNYPVNRALDAELRAKIEVLRALLSGKKEDWVAARDAYRDLYNAITDIALMYGYDPDRENRYKIALGRVRTNINEIDQYITY